MQIPVFWRGRLWRKQIYLHNFWFPSRSRRRRSFRPVVDAPSNILPFGLLSSAFDGVIVGWLGWLLENAKPAVRTNNLGTKDMPLAGNPRWLVALFPVSLGALVIGLLSVLYVVSVRVAIPD